MALDFDAEYTPASNPADADYPQGSAKNDAVPGDFSGSPLDYKWLNDSLGFLQSLLNYAGITPSGVPDTVLASDYFDAMVKRINALSQYLVDTGAADALVVTGDPVYTTYFNGMKIRVKVVAANTGAATINVDSLGVKSIKKFVNQALVAGDLRLDAIVDLEYDGTNFQMPYANHGHTGNNDGGGLGTLYSALRPYQNLVIKNGGTPDEQVDIDADWVILKDVSDNPRRIDTPNFTADNTASGQNGMFGAGVAANTFYAIWLTSGTSGNTSGLSVSGDLATVLAAAPPGYNTYGLLVGWILTDASSNFLVMYQIGNRARCLTGNWTISGVVASRDISAYVPETASFLYFSSDCDQGATWGVDPATFTLGVGGSFAEGNGPDAANNNRDNNVCPIETAQTIYDGRSVGNTVVYVKGWELAE